MDEVQHNWLGWVVAAAILIAVAVIPCLYLAGVAVYVGESVQDRTTKLCSYWWGFELLQKPAANSETCRLIENGAALTKHP